MSGTNALNWRQRENGLDAARRAAASFNKTLQPSAVRAGVFDVDMKFDCQACIGESVSAVWLFAFGRR